VTLSAINFESVVLTTLDGNDSVIGSAGMDLLFVSGGANSVNGGGGNDTIQYVVGQANSLDGGGGTDRLLIWANQTGTLNITVTGGVIDDGFGSILNGFEGVSIKGGLGNDIAVLGATNDSAAGGAGHDSLVGGSGNDQLTGGTGNDTLSGGSGNDILGGGGGDDLLFGGAGRDKLFVSLGIDTLTGGADADDFRFTASQFGQTTITDFTTGEDRLTIRAAVIGSSYSGQLDPANLSLGTAVGPQAQFVLIDEPGENRSTLVWDVNGANPAGGVTLIGYFTLGVALSASDIFMI
jgi:Ca2+-binding RTX toxin-like protein